jgi:hypothetical protein
MNLLSYTTYKDIRAVIGVSEDEMPDDELALDSYLFALEMEIDTIGASLQTDYATALTAVVASTATTAQANLVKATKLFAVFQVGKAVAYSLPMRAQKTITDGKAGVSRFADSPYKETLHNVSALLVTAKANLVEKYAALSGGTTTSTFPSFMSVVSPAIDPVTDS